MVMMIKLVVLMVVLAAACVGGEDGQRSCGSQYAADHPRARADLVFCHEHRKATCCSREDTTQLLIRASPLFQAQQHPEQQQQAFSEACRQWTAAMLCTPCDHQVGTGKKRGVCASACRQWFHACANDLFFTSPKSQLLSPCRADALVCSPLRLVVRDGAELCERAGLPPVIADDTIQQAGRVGSGAVVADAEAVQDTLRRFLETKTGVTDENADVDNSFQSPAAAACYDGRPSPLSEALKQQYFASRGGYSYNGSGGAGGGLVARIVGAVARNQGKIGGAALAVGIVAVVLRYVGKLSASRVDDDMRMQRLRRFDNQ
eukprot:TRINITY_DN27250_c0_g1_i1.p1 TRINITY_DN27250_c0_g1~~TRINITY_DN27250_c0_g1_i1.p1  ORF type:complete len:318 (+),score=131.21 TRINITY_DN27250_c0_g1_i1:3-956(+)